MGKTSGSNRTLDGPGIGSVPRKKGGGNNGRTLDGPAIGKAPGGSDKTRMPTNVHASNKPHPALGKGVSGEGPKQSYANPKVKCYAQGPQGKQSGGF